MELPGFMFRGTFDIIVLVIGLFPDEWILSAVQDGWAMFGADRLNIWIMNQFSQLIFPQKFMINLERL